MIIVDSLNHCAKEEQKLGVFIGSLARRQKIYAGIGSHRPVIVLSGTINTSKRFFMEQTNHSVTRRDLLHDLHGQLVVVGRNIRGRIDRSKFMLSWSNFVVLRLRQDAQFPQLVVQFRHICSNTRLNRSKVVVGEFLSLRRFGSKQGATCQNKIFSLIEQFFIDQEVLLFWTDRSSNALDVGFPKKLQNSKSLFV